MHRSRIAPELTADHSLGRQYSMPSNVRHSSLYFLLCILVITSPILAATLLIGEHLKVSPQEFFPGWIDEIYHWHQVATFKEAGFNGGYYTIDEHPAPAPLSHFNFHGPSYPITFGLLARLIGWKLYYMPYLNVAMMVLSLALFVFLTRPSHVQLVLTALIMLTFWPALIYTPTNMREVLFDALAIVLAAGFYRLSTKAESCSTALPICCGLLITYLSLFKISWTILYLPYFLLIRRRLKLSVLGAIAISGLVTVIAYGIYSLIIAPYPYFTTDLISAFKVSLRTGIETFVDHALLSLRHFFKPDDNPLWLMLRFQALLVIVVGFLYALRTKRDQALARSGLVIGISLSILLMENILLFDVGDWRDYRLIAPMLLFAIILLIAHRRQTLVALIVMTNLLVTPEFLKATQEHKSIHFEVDQRAVEQFESRISSVMAYNPEAGGWCNTLLVDFPAYMDSRMVGVPPGIGISWADNLEQYTEIKSRYLLISNESYAILGEVARLQPIASTEIGKIYLNLDADCPDIPQSPVAQTDIWRKTTYHSSSSAASPGRG